ncbi:uncharacterized protein LOC128209585 isoform X2 [Mya arenaria]|uniref:uncharacterized protein LOC128209585 isoform X2 n=1 Tax=Mya arenaria TaxID=6604 RepID=UPI0022DEDB44|nr:uncharacterized protein LOC128209585 isoform X2 [Mya arenaria]
MWNSNCLHPPPVCELKVTLHHKHKAQLHHIAQILQPAVEVWKNHETLLSTEQYVMRRSVYKLANQFRSEKSLRGLKQVLSCLQRLKSLDVMQVLSSLQEYVSSPTWSKDEGYLVSRQTIQYHLVRLQGMAGLLTQTEGYAAYTFNHIQQHLEAGKMVPQNIMLMSGAARIWYVCGSLCEHVCQWYASMIQGLSSFPPTPVPWLKEELPEHLRTWLSSVFGNQQSNNDKCSVAQYVHEQGSDNLLQSSSQAGSTFVEDIGEPVKRQEDTSELEYNVSVVGALQSGHAEMKYSHSVGKKTLEMFKHLLKKTVKTANDVEAFEQSVRTNDVQLGSRHFRVSKQGRKKLLKKIKVLCCQVRDKEMSENFEKMLVKKIRIPISKLLLTFCEGSETVESLQNNNINTDGSSERKHNVKGVNENNTEKKKKKNRNKKRQKKIQ